MIENARITRLLKAIDERDVAHAECVAAGNQLSKDIRDAIEPLVRRHYIDTGWTPAAIRIQMIEYNAIGHRSRQYIVGDVDVEVPGLGA